MEEDNRLLLTSSPLIFMHLACIGIFFTGFSWVAVAALAVTYLTRVFALTAGFHRYFSHRAFKTSRAFQFVLAWVGTSSAQQGPMWWAANHRHHHQHSDKEADIHSPVIRDAFWAHIGWVLCKAHSEIKYDRIKDLTKYPELKFIDRFHVLPVLSLIVALYANWLGPECGLPTAGYEWLTVGDVGLLFEYGVGLSRDVLCEFGDAHHRQQALCD
jgi:stearoyl-CoA desaturase (delta-9 desaturase)